MEAQTNRKCWYYVSRSNASRILRDRNILMKSDLRTHSNNIEEGGHTQENLKKLSANLFLCCVENFKTLFFRLDGFHTASLD